MRDFIETGLNIAFHDPLIRAGREMTHLGHRVMSPAIRAKPIGTREEIRLENRLQDQLESTLDHPISQRGNTEPATFRRSRLRDHSLPHRDWAETAVLHLS